MTVAGPIILSTLRSLPKLEFISHLAAGEIKRNFPSFGSGSVVACGRRGRPSASAPSLAISIFPLGVAKCPSDHRINGSSATWAQPCSVNSCQVSRTPESRRVCSITDRSSSYRVESSSPIALESLRKISWLGKDFPIGTRHCTCAPIVR